MGNKEKQQHVVVWDKEVEEFFDEYGNGQTIAVYFECLRYRQQLTPKQPFTISSKQVERQTGLKAWSQQNARRLLDAAGWIESHFDGRGYTSLVTDVGRQAVSHIKHRRSTIELRQVWSFPQKYR